MRRCARVILLALLVTNAAAASDEGVSLTKAPSVRTPVAAIYPAGLIVTGRRSGAVHLIVEVTSDGHVGAVEVSRSSGEPLLDAAALTAIRQFEFVPAEVAGVPAAVRIEYVFRFVPPPLPAPVEVRTIVNLRGRVLERGTREPLPGANVYLPNAKLNVETDREGRFEIAGVPSGGQVIEVQEARHQNLSTMAEITVGQATEIVVYLWKTLDGSLESTVRGNREKTEVSQRTLQHEELTTVPGTYGDPIRVITSLPGVYRPPYDSGLLLVRGADPEDTALQIDGVPVPTLFHFAGGPSVINPAAVDRIDFYPGAYGARYGRAIAGVLDVSTRSPEAKRVHGTAGVDLIQSNFYLEGPAGADGHWSVSARRSYLDAYLSTLLQAFQSPGSAAVVAAPRYWDYQARYNVMLGKNRLELMLFGSDDKLVAAQAGTVDTQGISVHDHQGFHRLRVKWSRLLESGWSVFVAPTVGVTKLDFNYLNIFSSSISSFDFNVRAAASKEVLPTVKVEAGLDLNGSTFDIGYQLPPNPPYQAFPDEEPVLPKSAFGVKQRIVSQAAYVDAVWTPIPGLRIVPGLRFELYELTSQTLPSVEPRLAARYELTSRTAVKAAVGLYRQSLQAFSPSSQFGNPLYGLSKSTQSVAGVEQRLAEHLLLDVQGYYNWRTNLVLPIQDQPDAGATIGDNVSNNIRGYTYGLEVLLKQELTSRLYGWIAYTLSRSVAWYPPTQTYDPADFDQTHLLTLVGSYKFDAGVELGLRFRLTTGRPTDYVTDTTYDTDRLRYEPIEGPWGTNRTPIFHQLDIRVEKTWTLETSRLSAYLDVQNVYNAQNPEFIFYDYRWRDSAPIRGLPILPTLGVTGSF